MRSNDSVNLDEPLSVPSGFKPPHPPFPLAGWKPKKLSADLDLKYSPAVLVQKDGCPVPSIRLGTYRLAAKTGLCASLLVRWT